MNFKHEANRMADDSHLPPVDGASLLAEGKRRVRRRNIAMTSVSLAVVAVVGMGAYVVGQNLLWKRQPPRRRRHRLRLDAR